MGGVPAGWYVDVTDPQTERWWDGTTWTGMFRFVIPAPPVSRGSNAGFFDAGEPAVDVGLEGILTGKAFSMAGSGVTSQNRDSFNGRSDPMGRVKPIRIVINVIAMVVLLLVVGTGTFLFLNQSPSAEAAVSVAMTSTLANRTADLTLSGYVGVGQSKVSVSGTGMVNFTTDAAALQFNTVIHGHHVTEQEVTDGDTIYLDLGPLVNQMLPGKSWITMNLAQLNQGGSASPLGIGGGLSTNNPAAILNVLGQNGNTVTALGPQKINGTPVQGYSVLVNQATLQSELAKAHLPSWMRQSVAFSGNLSVSYDVFIANTGMLYRMAVQIAVPIGGQSLTGVLNIDFSNFGAATYINPPPATDVAPYEAFLQKF